MPRTETEGRINQRRRTRKDLLEAAGRLLKQGRTPSMDDVAAEAMVSRATAYRYFPSLKALLLEAPLDIDMPDPAQVFAGGIEEDAAARVDRAEAALHAMCYRNETALRLMLAHSLEQAAGGEHAASIPVRQNRRGPLIAAALEPFRKQFTRTQYERLSAALALVFGTEAMVVFRDVLPLSPAEARRVKSWAIRALVAAALEQPRTPR